MISLSLLSCSALDNFSGSSLRKFSQGSPVYRIHRYKSIVGLIIFENVHLVPVKYSTSLPVISDSYYPNLANILLLTVIMMTNQSYAEATILWGSFVFLSARARGGGGGRSRRRDASAPFPEARRPFAGHLRPSPTVELLDKCNVQITFGDCHLSDSKRRWRCVGRE